MQQAFPVANRGEKERSLHAKNSEISSPAHGTFIVNEECDLDEAFQRDIFIAVCFISWN